MERTMQGNQNTGSVKVGETGWISLDSAGGDTGCGRANFEGNAMVDQFSTDPAPNPRTEVAPLFALAERARATLPERYPRLTFLVIALFLLISALTAEFEYLRGAGYSWP